MTASVQIVNTSNYPHEKIAIHHTDANGRLMEGKPVVIAPGEVTPKMSGHPQMHLKIEVLPVKPREVTVSTAVEKEDE